MALLAAIGLLAVLAPLVASDCPYTVSGRLVGPARKAVREIRLASRNLQRLASQSPPGAPLEDGRSTSIIAEIDFLRSRTHELAANLVPSRRQPLDDFQRRLAGLRAGSDAATTRLTDRADEIATASIGLATSYAFDDSGAPPPWLAKRRIWPLFARLTDPELVVILAGLGLSLLGTARWAWRKRPNGIKPATASRDARRGVGFTVIVLVLLTAAAAFLVRQSVGRDPTRWSYKDAIRRGEIAEASAVYPPVPYGPGEIDHDALRRPPLWAPSVGPPHLLGTDESGRDLLGLIIWGSRTSLLVATLSTLVLTGFGAIVGAMAGYCGGWIDFLLSRLIEMVQSIPAFVAIMGILAFSDHGLITISGAMALLLWPGVARLVRVEFLRLKMIDFTLASRALGCHPLRVMRHHLLPNALGPLLVAATFAAAGAIFVESGLSFLGLGPSGDSPSWGALLAAARHGPRFWWLSVFPGLLIFGAVASFNWLGETLRRAADPRDPVTGAS